MTKTWWLLPLLLSGCTSDPIVMNVAIGYRVSIVTAEAEQRVTVAPGAPGAILPPLINSVEVRTYADIAPGYRSGK